MTIQEQMNALPEAERQLRLLCLEHGVPMPPIGVDADEDEVRRWNSRARYLQTLDGPTLLRILERANMFIKGPALCRPMQPEAAMDLAIHQQRLCDKPRKEAPK